MGVLSLFGLGKQNAVSSIFGGEDPPKRKLFRTQAEIDAANAEAVRFAKSRGHHFANDVFVARKVGDPVPLYIDEKTGKEFVPEGPTKKLRYSIPSDVKLSDIKSEGGIYWYEDPKTGDVVEVASDVVNLPRFRTDKKKADEELGKRSELSKGKASLVGIGGEKINSPTSIFNKK